MALNCSLRPAAIDGAAGVTAIDVSVAVLIVSSTDADTTPEVAVIIAVPAVRPLANPPGLTVAIAAVAPGDQVTVLAGVGGMAGIGLAFLATRSLGFLTRDPRLQSVPIDGSVLAFAAASASILALLPCFAGASLPRVLGAALASAAGAGCMTLAARRAIHGQTGDVAGAAQQVAEILAYIVFAAQV